MYDTFDKIFEVLLMSLLAHHHIMNFGKAVMFLAIGFIPTLIALEMVNRMGRAIGKRGEVSSLAQQNGLRMLFA